MLTCLLMEWKIVLRTDNRVNIGRESQDQQSPGNRVQDTGFHVARLCRTY
jgi:hypothetical protein